MIARTGKIFTADPNPGNPLRWTGVTTIKPNRAEAFAMAGMVDPGASDNPLEDGALLQAGAALLEKFGIRSVLVTLSEHGMILFDREGPAVLHPDPRQRGFRRVGCRRHGHCPSPWLSAREAPCRKQPKFPIMAPPSLSAIWNGHPHAG